MALKHRSVRYDPADLQAWKQGHYNLLKRSKASAFLKQILVEKARRRRQGRIAARKPGDRRFFGEAFVAAHPTFAHRAGWYSSFKWLSAAAWGASAASSSLDYRAEFRKALDKYIVNLKQVQSKEAILRSRLGGKRAVAPDLWLFTGSKHRFIEVKLPGDDLKAAAASAEIGRPATDLARLNLPALVIMVMMTSSTCGTRSTSTSHSPTPRWLFYLTPRICSLRAFRDGCSSRAAIPHGRTQPHPAADPATSSRGERAVVDMK